LQHFNKRIIKRIFYIHENKSKPYDFVKINYINVLRENHQRKGELIGVKIKSVLCHQALQKVEPDIEISFRY